MISTLAAMSSAIRPLSRSLCPSDDRSWIVSPSTRIAPSCSCAISPVLTRPGCSSTVSTRPSGDQSSWSRKGSCSGLPSRVASDRRRKTWPSGAASNRIEIRSRFSGTVRPEGLTATTRGVPAAAIATPAANVQARPSAAARSLLRLMGSLVGLDVVGEAFMLEQHVLARLDVLQLEFIALEAVRRERVLRDEVGEPEGQLLADRHQLQPVLLQA